jgi:transcription elongation factor Elf1
MDERDSYSPAAAYAAGAFDTSIIGMSSMGQAKKRGSREQRQAEAEQREKRTAQEELPEHLNCQRCGHSMSVKWEIVSRSHSAYRGGSDCLVCGARAVHMVGDPAFLKAYSISPASLNAEQLDIFGKDEGGDIVHVYSSDKSNGSEH